MVADRQKITLLLSIALQLAIHSYSSIHMLKSRMSSAWFNMLHSCCIIVLLDSYDNYSLSHEHNKEHGLCNRCFET